MVQVDHALSAPQPRCFFFSPSAVARMLSSLAFFHSRALSYGTQRISRWRAFHGAASYSSTTVYVPDF